MAGISFRGVGKRYGNGVAAVHGLDLEIADREFLVLLGPSGCGKSTTLNMIAGLEEITEGVLRFDGQVMNNVPAHKRDVAMVFQSYALYPHKTVFENIAFGLRMRRVPEAELRRRVLDAATRLELTPLLERLPSQLSGGQRQRVALGRAMVRQPAVFLMDEPLSNLDASLRIAMRAQIRHLHAEMATTFVYVTHDQAEALTLADRIVVMRDGAIQQIGTPNDIYERPRTIFVASFLGSPAINLLEGELLAEGDALVFRRGALAIPIPPERAARIGRVTREVVLGLRAEDVGATVAPGLEGSGLADPGLDGPVLCGVVDTAMPAGSDLFLGLKVEGADVFVRVAKDARVREGERVSLPLVGHRLHLFERSSGKTLDEAA
ncbi:MAG: sn-glycerol-3-phosphate ABC transporter ATP-binding protein UgpC [Acetobacteraceae bacterium]